MLAARLLNLVLRDHAISLIDSEGSLYQCGPAGREPGIIVRLRRPVAAVKLLTQPSLAFGEAYMRGDIVIEQGTLRDLMKAVYVEQGIIRDVRWPRLVAVLSGMRSLLTRFSQRNFRPASRANVAHHYDLGNDVFELLLDPLMQYTCAFFPDSALPTGRQQALAEYEADAPLDLDAAQQRRVDLIIGKLGIREGMKVLDIGCGWGGLATEIARRTRAHVVGISLSKEQLAYARALADRSGVGARVELKLMDYRDLDGTYDRVTAAGVLEHIGKLHYVTFLNTIRRVLAPDGMALIDAAGRLTRAGGTNPWLAKYIFPGGYIPALSEITRAVDRTALITVDVEVSTLQYALTVREWGRRLARHADQIRAERGAEFLRMLELYLASSEMAMLHGPFANFQVQVANSRFAGALNRFELHDDAIAAQPLEPRPSWRRRPTSPSQPETLVRPRASQ